jgi:hypothetical protein
VKDKLNYVLLFKQGFIRGISWAFGATVGFIIISTIAVFVLQQLGGLPIVGNFIASVVQATLDQLVKRTPIFPQ